MPARAARQVRVPDGLLGLVGRVNPWQDMLSDAQRRLFNAACGDLAKQIKWHGFTLSKDDFRHLFSGTVLGWRTLPAYDMGDGRTGVIMLGGSSLDLRKEECTQAIEMAFLLGDDPSSQGIQASPVQWCEKVEQARTKGIAP